MLLCRSLQVHFSTPPVQKSYHEHDIGSDLCTTTKTSRIICDKKFLSLDNTTYNICLGIQNL